MLYLAAIFASISVFFLFIRPLIERLDNEDFLKRKDTREEREISNSIKKEKQFLFKIKMKMIKAGLTSQPVLFLFICFISAVLTYIVVIKIMKSPIFSIPASLGAIFIPNFFLNMTIRKRRDKMISQFVEMIEGIANYLRAGLSFRTALERISERSPEPLRSEILLILSDIRKGTSEAEAIKTAVYERVGFTDFKQFYIAVKIHSGLGGEMAKSLDSLATMIKDRRENDELKKAASTEARLSTYIAGSAPVVVFFIMYIMNPDYVNVALNDPLGRIGYLISFVLAAIGVIVVRKIAKAGEEL